MIVLYTDKIIKVQSPLAYSTVTVNVAGSDISAATCASQELPASNDSVTSPASTTGIATVVGVLPGLGDYTDSEQSDTSSSDSDIDTDLFKREPQSKHGQDSSTAPSGAKHRHH